MSYNQDKPIIAENQTGSVKWFNSQKGYGFISCDANGQDVFVHANQVEGGMELRDGQQVSFNVAQGRKGHEAVNVRCA